MVATIDIGNTRIKVGLFEDSDLKKVQYPSNSDELSKILSDAKVRSAIVSSVGQSLEIPDNISVLWFSHQTPSPIENKYATPETLGLDRLAGVIGASALFSGNDVLVIDAGTCITYDFMNARKEYLGGGISPGIKMKYQALNNYTSKLPLVNSLKETDLIGKSTETSIQSGVINGTIMEISGIIERYQNISDNLALVFCGGDGSFLSNAINSTSHVEENLVLYGLYEVHKYNA